MGFADLFIQDVKWTLVSLDDGTEIEGQFQAQNVRENVSGAWAQQGTLGLDQPILQFVRGELETIQFNVKVFARHQGLLGLAGAAGVGGIGAGIDAENIRATVDQIKNLARKDPDLGRPHVWVFAIGEEFSQQIVVQSVGGIRYDRFRPSDGSLRGVLFSMTLWRYEPFVPPETTTVVAESLVTSFKTGETYEHVAKRVHGDPLLGEALRRRNPDNRIPQEGDLVHVPSARILRLESLPLIPQSIPLKEGDAQRENKVNAFDARGGTFLSHVLKTDFGV